MYSIRLLCHVSTSHHYFYVTSHLSYLETSALTRLISSSDVFEKAFGVRVRRATTKMPSTSSSGMGVTCHSSGSAESPR